MEAAKDIGVHVDSQVLLVDESLVPCLDALMCPVCEWLFNQSVYKVDDPLPRQSSEVLFIWQVLLGLRIAQSFFDELFDAKTFVLRHREVPHSIAVDELPLTLDQLLQKVDRMALVWCKVRMALDSQEGVSRGLVSNDVATYTSRFDRNLDANILAVTCCLARSSPSSTILDVSFILIKISNALAYMQRCKDIFCQQNSFGTKKNSSAWNQDLSCVP